MRSSGNICKRISNADLAESSMVDDGFVQPLKKQKGLSNFRVYHPLNLHYCPLYHLNTHNITPQSNLVSALKPHMTNNPPITHATGKNT